VRITISKENYLKTIAEAESEGEAVIAATLARWLKVSAPAVTMAIRRLKRDELIRVGREGQITLTRSGRTIANRLLNRHHLIERMLTEVFGMEWYKVHEEAEQLEQLRALEHGIRIRVWETEHASLRIDTPEDLETGAAVLERLARREKNAPKIEVGGKA